MRFTFTFYIYIVSSSDFIVKSLTFFNKAFVQNRDMFLQLLSIC